MAIERFDIKDVSAQGLYRLNKNFEQIWVRVFGDSRFVKKVDERLIVAEESLNSPVAEITPEGFTLRDSNGAILISTDGVANSDNFSDTMNCESGFPLTISFFIDNDVSTLTKASIRYNNRPFRADSKTASSGGGVSTTTASGNANESVTGAEIPISVSGGGPVYGTHVTNGGQLVQEHVHQHDIAHAHNFSVPTHVHDPVYGIIEKPITDQTNQIYIDNVLIGSTTDARGIFDIDLAAHPIGAGWHDLEVRTTTLKRISVTMNIKSYIRR